jgi:hypothetical protein
MLESPWSRLGVALESPWTFRQTGVEDCYFWGSPWGALVLLDAQELKYHKNQMLVSKINKPCCGRVFVVCAL